MPYACGINERSRKMSLKDKEKEPTVIEDTVECIEALAKIVKENELSKIKISTEEIDIVIEGKSPIKPPFPPMPIMAQPAQPVQNASKSEPQETVSGKIIKSKIIGTFYTSPAPEKPPFVRVGDTIKEGDVVCIIESMKLMNEITSEFAGRVAEIYVNDGDTVEFDQKIMRIE